MAFLNWKSNLENKGDECWKQFAFSIKPKKQTSPVVVSWTFRHCLTIGGIWLGFWTFHPSSPIHHFYLHPYIIFRGLGTYTLHIHLIAICERMDPLFGSCCNEVLSCSLVADRRHLLWEHQGMGDEHFLE